MNDQKRKKFKIHLKKKKKSKENNEENSNIDNAYNNCNNDQCLSNLIQDQLKQKSVHHGISYVGWDHYFDDKKYKHSLTLKKVFTMEKFLKNNSKLIFNNNLMHPLKIDVNLLYNSEIFLENWPDFKTDLKHKPQYSLNCLGLAAYNMKINQIEQMNKSSDVKTMNTFVKVRLFNYEPVVSLKNIKVNYYGQLVTVKGSIIRVNRSYHMPLVLIILCNKCKLSYLVKQKNGIYRLKKKCDICKGIKFKPNLNSSYVETIPIQVIRIQQHFGEENDDQGQTPRVIDVELYEDLVNTCMPGDDVTITGIIKMQGKDNGKIKAGTLSSLYIEAISIVNNNKTKNNAISNIELNTKDYKLIKDINMNLNTLALLVHSLCPGIYGHEMIKMAFLLSLFGGSSKQETLRDNIHILVIGDPGLGKSQLLQACARIAPKGIYVSGNSSTSSGLTVTLVKEAGQNDFALEPGALVLADRGCCCIDEFDKMQSQHQVLLEAMEQQSVSVAKSGVIWSLPSRTSILAAANPIGGRYDQSKIFCRNVNMTQPLLSRFDLIFLLLDKPNKVSDNFLSEHVMLMHNGNVKTKNGDFTSNNRPTNNEMNFLKNRLITSKNSTYVIPSSLLRTYISYARQYVKPKLSNISATVLRKFYLNLRKVTALSGHIFPCNRQLEALIRLTEARAKMDLREETTEQDAMDVVELMQHTVLCLNNEKINHMYIKTKVYKSVTKIFLKLLIQDANEKNNTLYSTDELNDLGAKNGIAKSDILLSIEKLNDQGFLIQKVKNLYNFCSP